MQCGVQRAMITRIFILYAIPENAGENYLLIVYHNKRALNRETGLDFTRIIFIKRSNYGNHHLTNAKQRFIVVQPEGARCYISTVQLFMILPHPRMDIESASRRWWTSVH